MGYIVYWQTEYGATGHGDAIEYSLANAWVKFMTNRYPTHKYWIIKK